MAPHGLVQSDLVWRGVVQHGAVWRFIGQIRQPHILQCQIYGENLILHLSRYGALHKRSFLDSDRSGNTVDPDWEL